MFLFAFWCHVLILVSILVFVGIKLAKSEPNGDPKASNKTMCFQGRSRGDPASMFFSIVAPLGRFGEPFWRRMDFEGSPNRPFRIEST